MRINSPYTAFYWDLNMIPKSVVHICHRLKILFFKTFIGDWEFTRWQRPVKMLAKQPSTQQLCLHCNTMLMISFGTIELMAAIFATILRKLTPSMLKKYQSFIPISVFLMALTNNQTNHPDVAKPERKDFRWLNRDLMHPETKVLALKMRFRSFYKFLLLHVNCERRKTHTACTYIYMVYILIYAIM
uniref:Uncharacterized protein n=1 Tax=Glossina austeni TaxID=7395 RepID=A0A1A9VBJ5_GLOAU